MSQSTVLPPAMPKAADPAAPSGRAAPAAGETTTEGASFGEVLQSQMDKGLPVAETLPVAVSVPVDFLAGTDSAAVVPEVVAPEPTAVNVLTPPFVSTVLPFVAATVAIPVERAPITNSPSIETTSAPLVPIDVPTEAMPVPQLESDSRTDDAHTRPDTGSTTFGRQLVAAMGGDPAVHAKVMVEAVEPMADVEAVAAPTTVPIENTPQSVAAADPRREIAAALPVKVEVPQPLAAPGWRDAFADRVSWVANARQPAAEMQINPPNLGPVEIRVSMNADQASLSFFSPHAAVRDAIQSALPRLTEAFAASGLTLGNVFVGAESQSGQHPAQGDNEARSLVGPSKSFLAPVQLLRSRGFGPVPALVGSTCSPEPPSRAPKPGPRAIALGPFVLG